jgi:hypothetical protein
MGKSRADYKVVYGTILSGRKEKKKVEIETRWEQYRATAV